MLLFLYLFIYLFAGGGRAGGGRGRGGGGGGGRRRVWGGGNFRIFFDLKKRALIIPQILRNLFFKNRYIGFLL